MTPAEVLKREQAKAGREKLELAFLQQIRAEKLDQCAQMYRQARFWPGRKYAFDFAWPRMEVQPRGCMAQFVGGVAVEIDGLTQAGGRHQTIKGYSEDCTKLNEAALRGWLVLRVTGAHIKSGQAIEWLRRALAAL